MVSGQMWPAGSQFQNARVCYNTTKAYQEIMVSEMRPRKGVGEAVSQ
jgi:hypothetical protein